VSIGYQVLVESARWPTVAEFQAATQRNGFPIELTGLTTQDFGERLRETPNVGGLDVQVDGERVNLHAFLRALRGRRFEDDETNDILAELGADHRMSEGDYVFSVGLGSDPLEWRAACFVMATLVRDFGGYGYETQSNTHGRAGWAEDLIRGADSFERKRIIGNA